MFHEFWWCVRMKTEHSLRVTGNSKGISALFTPGRCSFQKARQKGAISLAFWRVLLTKETAEFQSSDCFQLQLCFLPSLSSCQSSFFFFFLRPSSLFLLSWPCSSICISLSSLSHYGLTWSLKTRSINYDICNICKLHATLTLEWIWSIFNQSVLSEKPF